LLGGIEEEEEEEEGEGVEEAATRARAGAGAGAGVVLLPFLSTKLPVLGTPATRCITSLI
jgi:hypothetical protein